MVTLIVGYILYIANPPQTPVLPFVFLLTIYILSSFLVQIPPLTQLYGPRPFALVFTLTLPFQILSSIFKIFLVLTLLLLSHLVFLPFLLASLLCFFLFSGFFYTRVDILLFSPPLFSSQFWGCILPAMASPRSPPFFPDHIHPSLLVLYVSCNTSCILSHTLPFFYYYLFYLYS